VNIEDRPAEGAEDQVNLDVSVSEKARYNVAVFAGYGSYELLRGKVSVEDGNLFGTGHRAQVEGHGSFRGEGASLEYLNPFVFDDRISHHANGFFDRREHPSFRDRQYGGETGLGYRLTENVRTTALYRLKESEPLEVDPDIPPELVSDVFLSTIGSSTVMDWRNNIVDPDRGSTHHLMIEYSGGALGSELDFLRVTAFTSWILPLFGEFRLVAAARAGVTKRLADTDVIPIQERFFNGGEYTIRSFLQDEAGPKVDGEPIGGEAFTALNLELRFPLGILEGLRGAVFGDTGTLTEEVEEFAGGRYYFGVGTGVRYNTPFGPLRVDVAFNPDRAKGEDLVVVHFGLGYPF
jgi:outer membrane protein insertion porin family